MGWLTQPLLWLLAGVVNRALAQQVDFLKAENTLLRARLPRRLTITCQERQTLLRWGRPLGAALQGLLSMVSFRTFVRWLREGSGTAKKSSAAKARAGRKPTPALEALPSGGLSG